MKAHLPFLGQILLAVGIAYASQQAPLKTATATATKAAITGSNPPAIIAPKTANNPPTINPLAPTTNPSTQPAKIAAVSTANPLPTAPAAPTARPFESMSDQELVNTIARDIGLKKIPKVVHACTYEGDSGYQGLAVRDQNILALCPSGMHGQGGRLFTAAHEVFHFKADQEGKKPTEQDADKGAIDYYAARGMREPLENAANLQLKPGDKDYQFGVNYAKQRLRELKP